MAYFENIMLQTEAYGLAKESAALYSRKQA